MKKARWIDAKDEYLPCLMLNKTLMRGSLNFHFKEQYQCNECVNDHVQLKFLVNSSLYFRYNEKHTLKNTIIESIEILCEGDTHEGSYLSLKELKDKCVDIYDEKPINRLFWTLEDIDEWLEEYEEDKS